MRTLFLIMTLVVGILSTANAVTYYTYVNGGSSGPWANAGTWTTDPSGLTLIGSAVPANSDNVVILNGFTVILGANVTTTGHSVTINAGGVLDLATFTISPLNVLAGTGMLRMGSGFFPMVTTNTLALNTTATVEYYDFTGTIPASVNYPNLTFRNTTATNHTIRVSNASSYNLAVAGNITTISSGTGSLTLTLGTQAGNPINATISRNVNIGANTTINAGIFNSIHSMSVLGNMTNNGTVDFSNSAQYSASNNGAVHLTFTGSTNNTLACNGSTDLYTLTVNKGSSSTYILSLTSTNVANLRLFSNGALLTITNGTLRLGANIDIPRIWGSGSANYDVGSVSTSPMLWIDGADVSFGSAALVVYGKFRITAGSFSSLGGQGTVIREDGQYIIEGGTFTTTKFRPSSTSPDHRGTFIMSGGTFNAIGVDGSDTNYARFSHPYPEQVFIMTGGTINVHNAQRNGNGANGGIHIGSKASNYTITGGTFNAVLSGAAPFFNITSTVPFWNLNISRIDGATTARLAGTGTATGSLSGSITTAQPLTVLNEFTIDGANSPIFDAGGLNVTLGGNLTINAGGTYTPGNNTTIFNGATDQLFSNNGTITSGLYDMEVNKASGTISLGGSASSFTVTHFLNIQSGVLNDNGKTLNVSGNIYNQAFHTGTGSITLNGSATQTISGDGTGAFGNIVLANANNPGVQATADLTISGILTLAGTGLSLFDIGIHQLRLSSSSAGAVAVTGNAFSSSKMIRTAGFQSDGGVRKTYGSLSAFTFPFGSGTNYTPATVQLTSAPTTYGDVTMRPVNARHPLVSAGNTNNLTWYWKATTTGFTGIPSNGVSMVFHYLDANVVPAGDDSNYIPARYNPTAWMTINDPAQVVEGSNQIRFTNVGYLDGEFTAGVASAFGIVRIFYSKRSGNWNNVTPGATPWSNVSHTGPDASVFPTFGDQVYIGDGVSNNHTITITTNGQGSGGLELNAGSTLNVGTSTGHNFGAFDNQKITGSGTLRISAASATAQFPAGDFGNFIRAAGGTVEYYSTGVQDFTIPVSSAAPTNLPLDSYRHLIITPGTGRYVTMPNQDLRIYGNMTVQGVGSTGVARLNSAASRALTIDGNLSVSSGNLQFRNAAGQALEIGGNLLVAANAIFDHSGIGGDATNTILLNGNLVNNGTLDFFSSNGRVTNITFTGVANTGVTGTGATTDFSTVTVAKGLNQSSILEVNATAFTLSGASPTLTLQSGTFRLTSAQTLIIANGTDFTIPAAARLSANGGTLRVAGGNGVDLLLSGTLEILNGTVDIGTVSADNSIEYAATGTPTISASGGFLNVRSQIRRSGATAQGALIYNQSGNAVVRVGISSAAEGTRGIFEILNTGSQFNTSGGTLEVRRGFGSGSQHEVFIQPTSSTVTGGTIELGMVGTGQTIRINTTAPLYNLTVTGTSTIARLEANPLTLRGSLEIQPETVFNANGLNVSVAGNFTNLNSSNSTNVTGGGYRPGSASQITTLNGSTNHQNLTGTSGNLSTFANLVINNTFASGVIALQANTNVRVNGMLTMTSGTVAGGANTITALGTISNSARHTSTAGGSLRIEGGSMQVITGNGNGVFGAVVLNNASGALLGANQEITETLTFTNGALTINSNRLTLSSPSLTSIVGANASRYIITSGNLPDGGVTKTFAASVTSGSFTFPIGVPGKYTPASYLISTGGSGGTINVKPVNGKHPNATGSGTAYINYYWSVTNTGVSITSLTHTYTYLAADESGNIMDYFDARFQDGAWAIGVTPGNPNTATRVITFTNTNLTGDYTAGEATAFVNPTTYTSIASGSWNADLSVWDVDPPGTNLGPPPGSFVIISEGTTVTIPTNNKRTASLDIRGRLHLGTTTGHDFSVVTTSGAGERTMQLQSSTFPSGNFSAFTSAGGGTVEYNGTVTLPTQPVYNNLTFTGAGIKVMANADLTVNGGLTIIAGTVDNATHNSSITLVSPTSDLINNSVFVAGTGAIAVGRNLTNNGPSASFSAGNGTDALIVSGNLTNSGNALFQTGTDSVGVRGSLLNSGTFIAGSGAIRITNSLTNTSGSFSAGSGVLRVKDGVTNNATYNAGTGEVIITGALTNTGASAIFAGSPNVTTLSGDFINSAGAVFNANSGAYTVGGNWTNTATFNAQNSNVNFVSATNQTVSGATVFYNASKGSGGSLILNSGIGINNQLTFTDGRIITGSNVVSLTNTAVQPVIGYDASSYIDGIVAISFPDAAGSGRVFPVGKGSVYRPVTIRQTAASSTPVVRVEMINTPPTGTPPPGVGILSEARYYSVDLLSGTIASPTVELSFNTNGVPDEDIPVPGNARIVRGTSSSGPWTDEGGSGVFSPADPAGYATSGITSISNPTYFALAYPDGILPIGLSKFEALLLNGEVHLEWQTYSELNNHYFTIERSSPELHFDSLGQRMGAGTSITPKGYSFIDRFPLTGRSYYRLKQTDFNGTHTYSDVIGISNADNTSPVLRVVPNPTEPGTDTFVRLYNASDPNVMIYIFDTAGRLLIQKEVQLNGQISLTELDNNGSFRAGMYLMKVFVDNGFVYTKFTVK